MLETLLGVVIGGIIGSIIPFITIIYSHKKWKSEQRIEYLKLKRDQLEKIFKKAYEATDDGMKKGSFPIDVLSDYDFLLPKNVSNEFDRFIKSKEKDPLKIKFALYNISRSMKKELHKIENEIENEVMNG